MGLSPTIIPFVDIGVAATKLLQQRTKQEKSSKDIEPSSDYTLIMPLYNKENEIRTTLQSWEDYKDKIIVVDDGSRDNGPQIVKDMGFNLVSYGENRGKINAILEGLKQVNTKYSIVIDADVRFDKTSKKTLDDIVGEIKHDGIEGGAVEIISNVQQEGSRFLLGLQYLDHKIGMKLGKKALGGRGRKQVLVSGGFGVYKTDVLKDTIEYQLGNDSFFVGEDLERNLEVLAKGGQIGYYEGFRVIAEAPKTWREFTTQRIRWKEGELRYISKYLKKMRGKALAESIFTTIVSTIGNPIKVASIPIITYYGFSEPFIHSPSFQAPDVLAAFYGTFVLLSAVLAKYTLSNKEFYRNLDTIALYPFFKLYEMVATLPAYKIMFRGLSKTGMK